MDIDVVAGSSSFTHSDVIRKSVRKELLSCRVISLNVWALCFMNESKVLVIFTILGIYCEIVTQKGFLPHSTCSC